MACQFFFLFVFIPSLVTGQDIIRKTFCWNQEFRLDCNWSSILAIHEAYFTNDIHEVNSSDCPQAALNLSRTEFPCTEDVKCSVNKRCSGIAHCRYNMTADHRERQCYCKGIIVVRYACIPESQVTQSCNTKVSGASGYISSPGYPRFYPKVQQCNWILEGSKGEELFMELLDMDTRPPTRGKVLNYCPDSLTVFEDFHKLRYSCGPYNNETKRPIQSSGKKVHLEFKSLDFMPSRGFLLYYKVLGCVTLPPPKLGYMVYRNKSTALYMCCKDHVFNDTHSNLLFLHCVDEMRWNGTIAPCVSLAELRGRNLTKELDDVKLDIVEVYLNRNKYIEEVLIPTACVVGLIFGHAAAILLVLKIRKKRKTSGTNHLNTSRPLPSAPYQPPPPPPPPPPSVQQAPTVSTVPMAPRVLITDL